MLWSARASFSELGLWRQILTPRSFRYSNSGLPLLNLDLGFSAFLQSGPALHVVAQILGSGAGGMRGGPAPPSLDQLDERQISILKKKLRGARVSCVKLLHC